MSGDADSDLNDEVRFDWERDRRTGVGEAVFAAGKTDAQLIALVEAARGRDRSLLLTRLEPDPARAIGDRSADDFRYDPTSRCGVLDRGLPVPSAAPALIVTAGTSDLPIAREAQQALAFHGFDVALVADCGVAGLWRLEAQRERLSGADVVIAVAGMEGALFPVIAGLCRALVIAVPTSIGYGVATGGRAALGTALATCAPGVVTVNVDNGFGAACAAIKVLQAIAPQAPQR